MSNTKMNKKKIFNDPVYGFINIPFDIVFDLIEDPIFQRLRRISQTGMTHLVYPGAQHTRFHHALGAMHLMQEAVKILMSKGVEITREEAKAVCIGILLHDVGHGPFSHALEYELTPFHHEKWSLLLMQKLNAKFNGALDTAIAIFTDQYPKKFLHQLISGQLDMDRMDYLNRDSFFTGVTEGKISYDRLIKMLNVIDDQLVVEQKGMYSVEKFIMARSLMYWQVYLHKTVISAEQMIIHLIRALKNKKHLKEHDFFSPPLQFFLQNDHSNVQDERALENFILLDDFDIYHAIKVLQTCSDPELRLIAHGLHNRRLFRCILSKTEPEHVEIDTKIEKIGEIYQFDKDLASKMMWTGKVTTATYTGSKEEIKILMKNGEIQPLSEVSDHDIKAKVNMKYFMCFPKI